MCRLQLEFHLQLRRLGHEIRTDTPFESMRQTSKRSKSKLKTSGLRRRRRSKSSGAFAWRSATARGGGNLGRKGLGIAPGTIANAIYVPYKKFER